MAPFTMQSVFPAPLEQLWIVLKLHVEDDQIGRIHPNWVLSQRLVNMEGNRWVLERKLRLLGKNYTTTMAVEMASPETFRWEIVAADGLLIPGSYVENRYTEAGERTKVSTTVDMSLKGVPGFLQSWMLKRFLSQGDDQDLEYLRKMQI